MKTLRYLAAAFLLMVFLASVGADFLSPAPYERQFRDHPNEPPSRRFPLGTDELGRDRLSRLLHGSRVSLLLAPAAALLAVFLAALVGLSAGFLGGWFERAAMACTDLFVSLPWLFLLLTVRALLPLNVAPWTSVSITFLLLGLLGWASAARVIRAGAAAVRGSDFALQARAAGCRTARLMMVHLLPNLRPAIAAQFWISIPVFIWSEANLGMLGLGVTEPLPSWGNLLLELANYRAVFAAPWLLAPAVLLVLVSSGFHFIFSKEDPCR
ncbi:MAG: ABC transporter permease [Candidatus Solibacter usitatus]|nr:ABC transporter permease [Candidatus Solibacter usitatus]